MAKKVTIPNWHQFGVMVAGIILFKYEDDDEQPRYQAGYTLFLDNGEEVNEDTQPVITIITELESDNYISLASLAYQKAVDLFYHVSSTFAVLDEDGELINSEDLSAYVQTKPTLN